MEDFEVSGPTEGEKVMGKLRIFAAMVTAALLVSCDQTPSIANNQSGEDPKTVSPKVIYGADDRRDLYEVQNQALLDLAQSTVALMNHSDLDQQPDGSYKIKGTLFGSAYGLCQSEPYYHQKIAAYCSGFLVAPDKIATAGHCIRSAGDCNNTVFVFGFAMTAPGVQTEQVDDSQVYSCAEIIDSEVGSGGRDYAVVRLDRPVLGRPVLEMRQQGEVSAGDDLVVIGHPAGLPVKIAGGASVRDVSSEFFSANLDTYGGNSGSAVFNASNGQVEGILVRGETDFVYRNGCRLSNQCSNGGCRGEDVTKISYVVDVVGASGGGEELELYSTSFTGPLGIPDYRPQGVTAQVKWNTHGAEI